MKLVTSTEAPFGVVKKYSPGSALKWRWILPLEESNDIVMQADFAVAPDGPSAALVSLDPATVNSSGSISQVDIFGAGVLWTRLAGYLAKTERMQTCSSAVASCEIPRE